LAQNKPSVENVNTALLSHSLDLSDFFVGDRGIPEIIIGDMALVWFANEKRRFRSDRVNVFLELNSLSDPHTD
jgi:hypothetical protein